MVQCPVCNEPNQAKGTVRFCETCFHGWRVGLATRVNYARIATDKAYEEDRACAQMTFFGPQLFAGMRIFELGCGQGSLATWLKNTLGEVIYHGLEPSPNARQAAQVMDQVWRDWETFAKEGQRYHLIIASHVLEHIGDLNRVLTTLLAHLEPGGAIFIEVPNGSGHPQLPLDFNPGHVHYFSINSIMACLSRFQLRVKAVASGAFESYRYPDSIRVLAQHFVPPRARGDELAHNLSMEPGELLVVWGAGGMARELLEPYFPADIVHCFLDSDARLHDTRLMGHPVMPPTYLARLKRVALLISSLDHENAIREEVMENYSGSLARIISMRDLLG